MIRFNSDVPNASMPPMRPIYLRKPCKEVWNELLDVSNKNNDRHLEITELRDALRMFEINSHKDHRQVTENAKLIVKTNARLEKENKA